MENLPYARTTIEAEIPFVIYVPSEMSTQKAPQGLDQLQVHPMMMTKRKLWDEKNKKKHLYKNTCEEKTKNEKNVKNPQKTEKLDALQKWNKKNLKTKQKPCMREDVGMEAEDEKREKVIVLGCPEIH